MPRSLCRLTDFPVEQRVHACVDRRRRLGVDVCVWMHSCACLFFHFCSYVVMSWTPSLAVAPTQCTGACALACVHDFVYVRAFV